jgi:O-antigen/teichoic acid export membrane protein
VSTQVSLRDSARQALISSAALSICRDALQFVQMIVLARLLDPQMYGAAAMSATVISFVGMASFTHVVTHMLQVRSAEVNYDEYFTAGLALNGIAFLVANAVALAFHFMPDFAAAQPLLHVSSLTFLVAVPAELHQRALERQLAWARLRNVQFAALLASAGSALLLAWVGAGAYALVVPGVLSVGVVAGDLLLVQGWRPQLRWSLAGYRDAAHFGLNRASSNALNGGRTMIQNTLISNQGQFFALGLFSRADALANLFCTRVSQQVAGALFPIVTRTPAASERFARISSLALRAVCWTLVPIAAYGCVEARGIVHALYGSRWEAVVPLLPWAMACSAALGVGACCYSFLLANDQMRLCLRADAFAFALLATAMFVFIPAGVEHYLMAALACHSAIAITLLTLLVRTRGTVANMLPATLLLPMAAAGLGAGAAHLADALAPGAPLPLALALSWSAFTVTYLAVLRVTASRALGELVSYLPGARILSAVLRLPAQ